ncbi:MAG: ATP-dependent helicase [Candidatus Eremiobacteraeota bacterium]|nr:ATP-dependent helicase [Candidatus Eremiobacteraeota bacterium]MCW5869680.1 ATP-dependent helicase [Candidatus Eremiobacteraeota bacterium]
MRTFGRGLVLLPGQTLPPGWEGVERVVVRQPAPEVLEALSDHWLQRRPVVVELHLPISELRQPEICEEEPYRLEPDFEFARERLHFLVWANNYDGTKGEPIWWHGRLAQRLGFSGEVDGGPRCTLPMAVLHRESVELGSVRLSQPEAALDLELAPDQLQAVRHRGGAARVLAPAGSGKTRVLTQRLAYLLGCGFEKERVTALAYNRRAALEMRQRLPQAPVGTLHALGYALLRRDREVRVAEDREVRAILSRLVKPPPLLNQDPLQPYLEGLQQVRLGLVEPQAVEESRDDVPGLAEAFPEYRQELRRRGLVDHDEQIYGALELLLRHPEARKQAQRSCTHLLVDEFQDLTPAFLLLVRLLCAPAYQVFGVGDDDQVIYGYAGATPDYLVHFQRYFHRSSAYILETNYRCPAPIVEAAGHLLGRNRLRVAKQIHAAQSEGTLRLEMAPAAGCALRAVELVEAWLSEHVASDLAVLARVNAVLMPVQLLLAQRGIPYSRSLDSHILQRTGLRSALAYLRLALHPTRLVQADLADALRRPSRKLKRELLEKASRCRSLDELWKWGMQQEAWPASQIDEFVDDLRMLGRHLNRSLSAFFQALRQQTDFLQALDQLDRSGLGLSGSSHRDDLLALEQCAAVYEGPPEDFVGWLEELLDRPGEESGVRLSSVHRVKGQEWPCVVVYGVNGGLFPHRLSEDEEEERRILHVAITRARRHCVLLAEQSNLSPMLAEMQPPPPPVPKKKKKRRK